MKTEHGIKCPKCGKRNRIQVEKVLLDPEGPKPKVQVFFSSYLPLKTEKCRKCGEIIAQEKTPIRITKTDKVLALIVILPLGFLFAFSIIIMIQGFWVSTYLWLITACIAFLLVSFSHSTFKPKVLKKILVCVLIAFVLVIPAYVTYSSMDYQSLAQNVATQKEITYFKNVLGRSYNYTELIQWENQHIVYLNDVDKRPSDPIEILEYGKGKCREFAILYAALSISQGYQCRIVDFPLNDHAINEVKIDGSWIPVDASTSPQGYVNDPLIYEREGQPPRILALAFEGSSIVDVTATYRSDHLSILLSPLMYFFVIVASWLSFCIYLIWKRVQWKRDIFKRRI